MIKLLLIRHAESTGNAEGRMQGQQAFALTQHGREQAQRLAQHLLQLPLTWPTQIYSSPLLRTRQTTEILVQALAAYFKAQTRADHSASSLVMPTLNYKEELQEFDPGILAGLTWAEAKKSYPDLCAQLEATPTWIPIPGAETLQAGRDRSQHFLRQLFHRHDNSDRVWIISHEWIMQQLIAGIWQSPLTWQLPIALTGVFEFEIDRDRWLFPQTTDALNSCFWQVRRFNDTGHLDAAVEPDLRKIKPE